MRVTTKQSQGARKGKVSIGEKERERETKEGKKGGRAGEERKVGGGGEGE